MGAPTGSFDVENAMCDGAETILPLRYPVIVNVAACPVEWTCMAAQVAGLGVQVQDVACCGVNFGNSLLGATHWGSIAPVCIRTPLERAWRGGALSAKDMPICQDVAAASLQMNVGGVMPGGKMEPFSG